MFFIGDVHGKVDQYNQLIKNMDQSIQVGDMSFDYSKLTTSTNHRFIKGNHDHYETNHPNDLGDFGFWNDIMFIRGAFSIDKQSRFPGVDWFPQEQLEYSKFMAAIDLAKNAKPEIIVSHDCPQFFVDKFMGYPTNATRIGLDGVYHNHKPKLWVFGHHHRQIDITIDNTRFVCLDELQTFQK